MKVTVIKTVKGKSPMRVSDSALKHDDINRPMGSKTLF